MSDTNPPDDNLGAPKGGLFSSTLIMASGTVVSRILGAVRVLLVAYLLGANTRQSEIFNVASTVPNSVYMLLAGGILNAILVPQLVRAIKNDEDQGQAFTNRIVTLFLLFLLAITIILVAGAPVVAWLTSASAWHVPALAAQYHSLVLLTALCLPQVFFYGMFVMGGQILNARGSFGPMMWAPVANNIIQVIVLAVYAVIWGFHTDTSQPFTLPQILVLGVGSVIGVATQIIVLIPFLKRVGFSYHPRFDFLHTGLGRVAQIAKWAVALAIINQINYIITTRLGTLGTVSGEGAGNAAYNAANLIWILPHALITVSLVTALVPTLSRLGIQGDLAGYSRRFVSAARILTVAILPLSMLYVAIGVPIATMAFRGNTGGAYIGWTLSILGLCLMAWTLQYLVIKSFNALEDTRTPFFIQVLVVTLWCSTAAILIKVVGVPNAWVAPAMGAAYSFAYIVSSFVAWAMLKKKVPGIGGGHMGRYILQIFLISVPGTILATLICYVQKAHSDGFIADFLGLLVAVVVAGIVYLGLAKITHVKEMDHLVTTVRSRLGRRKGTSEGN